MAQLFTYIDALKQRAAKEGVDIRAVLITAEGDDALNGLIRQLSAATGFRVDWHIYSAELHLSLAG